jgi:5'-nucleotidase / UDP-sugar diphosphatase
MNMHAVDLILSGHNHDRHIDFDGRTAFVESEQDANYLTVVDIDVIRTPDNSNGSLAWWPEFRIIDTANIEPDPKALANKVRDYQARLEKQIDAEIATLGSPLDSRTDCVRLRECAIGNFIADAVRKAAGAEIAIINGGGIRGNRLYAAGTKLTKRDVLDELPFGNKTVLTIVAGSAILSALENGLSRIGTGRGVFHKFPGLPWLSILLRRQARESRRQRSIAKCSIRRGTTDSRPMIV